MLEINQLENFADLMSTSNLTRQPSKEKVERFALGMSQKSLYLHIVYSEGRSFELTILD